MTSNGTGKIGLREPGEYTRGPNLASRDNVAHIQSLYTILETPLLAALGCWSFAAICIGAACPSPVTQNRRAGALLLAQ